MNIRHKNVYKIIWAVLFAIFSLTVSGCSTTKEGESPFNNILNSLGLSQNQQTADTNSGNLKFSGSAAVTAAPVTGTESPIEAAATETPLPTPTSYNILLWVPPAFDVDQDTKAGKALEDLIKTYIGDHPNVNIHIRVKATGGDSSMINTLTTASHVAQDVLPSLALISRSDMETAVQRNLILPLETEVFSDNDSWYNFARQSAAVDSTIYGIPVAGDGLILTYKTAKTGTELGDWQDILTRGLPIGFAPSSSTSLFGLFVYMSLGGKITNDQGQPYLDQQKLFDTLNFFLTGGQNGAFPPAIAQLVDQSQVWQRFNDGTLSIIVSNLSGYRHYQDPDLSLRTLPLAEGVTEYPLINTWNLVVLEENPTIQPEVIRFAEYFSDKNVNDAFSSAAGFLPVRNSEHKTWSEDPQFGMVQSMSEKGLLIPNSQITNKIIPIINNAVVQVIKNQMSPEDAAKEAITSLN